MPGFALRLSAPDTVTAAEAASSFYWLTSYRSSFTGDVGPNAGRLGVVSDRNTDFLRIALAAFATDRTVPRVGGGSNWNQRQLNLQVPVSDAATWQTVAGELSQVLGFLSGDAWSLTFVEEHAAPEPVREVGETPPSRIVLFSGGADSAIGGLYSKSLLASNQRHVLVSHYSATFYAPIQRHLASELQRLLPGSEQEHLAIHVGRRERRLDGTKYPTEPSSRSRSLLFIALGLAVASIHSVPLWVPENGFASLNPPLGPERLGSLSTRTTHPAFLGRLADVLTRAGAHAVIENPFDRLTKGEMYQRAVELVDTEEASRYLSATHSCSLAGQRAKGVSPALQCGVCFGCVLRRASFAASGVTDTTPYLAPHADPAVQQWLVSKSVEQPVRNFIRRGVRARDLAAMGLPSDYPLRDALSLCERGIAEIRSLYQ